MGERSRLRGQSVAVGSPGSLRPLEGLGAHLSKQLSLGQCVQR